MNGAFLVIPKKSKEPSCNADRKAVYEEFARYCSEMLDNAFKSANKTNFRNIEEFIKNESSSAEFSVALPACLLTTSERSLTVEGDFANTRELMGKLHEHLTEQRLKVLKVEGESVGSFRKCVHAVNRFLVESAAKAPYKAIRRSLSRKKSKFEQRAQRKKTLEGNKTQSSESTRDNRWNIYTLAKTKEPLVILIPEIQGFPRDTLNSLLRHLM